MEDKHTLIAQGFIPLSKYWSTRLGFLDIINDTKLFIPLIEKRKDIGDDLKVLIRISKEWRKKSKHQVGEAGALFRLLQFASWKLKLNKKFVKSKTLVGRNITDNPDIVNWPIAKLLELDNETPQWASAAILTGNREETPDNYFLNLSKEALRHYNQVKNNGGYCELRYDQTILSQAEAFIDILKGGRTDFRPRQQDDYCFARVFSLINKKRGENNWPELKGHESNRLEEMEKQLANLASGRKIDSRDHRVVYSIAMLATAEKIKTKFSHPDCVSKSWPQFWKFLEYCEKRFNGQKWLVI